jgi:hypothetical protein
MFARRVINKRLVPLMSLIAWSIAEQCATAQKEIVSFPFIADQFVASISDETLKVLPPWKPGDGEPPVSPGRARLAADRVLATSFDANRFPDCSVQFARLELVSQYSDDQEFWIWLAVYETSWKGRSLHSWLSRRHDWSSLHFGEAPIFVVPVLMNGEAIQPAPIQHLVEYSEAELRDMADSLAAGHPPGLAGPWLYQAYTVPGVAVATVGTELLERTPAWKPADENPPVAFVRALAAATPIQQHRLPSDDRRETTLEYIDLQELQKNKWVWCFNYQSNTRVGGQTGIPAFIEVAVLMDGKAVEPVTVEQRK